MSLKKFFIALFEPPEKSDKPFISNSIIIQYIFCFIIGFILMFFTVPLTMFIPMDKFSPVVFVVLPMVLYILIFSKDKYSLKPAILCLGFNILLGIIFLILFYVPMMPLAHLKELINCLIWLIIVTLIVQIFYFIVIKIKERKIIPVIESIILLAGVVSFYYILYVHLAIFDNHNIDISVIYNKTRTMQLNPNLSIKVTRLDDLYEYEEDFQVHKLDNGQILFCTKDEIYLFNDKTNKFNKIYMLRVDQFYKFNGKYVINDKYFYDPKQKKLFKLTEKELNSLKNFLKQVQKTTLIKQIILNQWTLISNEELIENDFYINFNKKLIKKIPLKALSTILYHPLKLKNGNILFIECPYFDGPYYLKIFNPASGKIIKSIEKKDKKMSYDLPVKLVESDDGKVLIINNIPSKLIMRNKFRSFQAKVLDLKTGKTIPTINTLKEPFGLGERNFGSNISRAVYLGNGIALIVGETSSIYDFKTNKFYFLNHLLIPRIGQRPLVINKAKAIIIGGDTRINILSSIDESYCKYAYLKNDNDKPISICDDRINDVVEMVEIKTKK